VGPAEPKMTLPTQAVLRAFLEDPTEARYGLEIGTATGLPSGTIHPILARLESVGWANSDWEDIDPSAENRPRRRYYRLTENGVQAARLALARADAARVRISMRGRQAAGGTT
jgi:PadR family transcriptional regulator